MNREVINKANELIEIIDELNSYKKFKHEGNHFEFVHHYGSSAERIKIPREFNGKFIKILDEIINEYEQELNKL